MVSDLAKEKVFWTKSMNISLAKYMEDHPNIWDPKHPKYSNIGLRDETFANFAAKYNNEFSWQAVKDRWTNIRSTYGFYMRKIQARKAKGEVRKTTVDGKIQNFGQDLNFYLDVLGVHDMKRVLKNFKVNWFMWQPCKYLYKVHKFADKKGSTNSKPHESDASNAPEYSSDESNSDNVTCESVIENVVNVFKGVQNDAFGTDKTKYAAVGQAVTKKLSELNSYDAALLSQKILDVLAQYDENNPMNPNNS